MLHAKSGGHSPCTQSSVFPVSTGFFGKAIGGLIEIDTESHVTAHWPFDGLNKGYGEISPTDEDICARIVDLETWLIRGSRQVKLIEVLALLVVLILLARFLFKDQHI